MIEGPCPSCGRHKNECAGIRGGRGRVASALSAIRVRSEKLRGTGLSRETGGAEPLTTACRATAIRVRKNAVHTAHAGKHKLTHCFFCASAFAGAYSSGRMRHARGLSGDAASLPTACAPEHLGPDELGVGGTCSLSAGLWGRSSSGASRTPATPARNLLPPCAAAPLPRASCTWLTWAFVRAFAAGDPPVLTPPCLSLSRCSIPWIARACSWLSMSTPASP